MNIYGWRKRLGSLSVALAVAAGGMVSMIATPVHAQAWSFYTYNNVVTAGAVRGNFKFAEQVAKETNNALTIRVHLGGTLQINGTMIGSAVADNVVQMGDDAFLAGLVPIGDLIRLPMLIRDQKDLDKATEIMTPYMASAYEKRGIVLLGSYMYPKQVIWSRKKLTSLEDLKGQKIRVTAPEHGEFIRRFGGLPLTMSTAEVVTSLERGVIDGATTASSGAGFAWKDLLKFNYRLGLGHINANIIVNKAAFDKLPAQTQAVLRKVTAEVMPGVTQGLAAEESVLTEKIRAGGMTVVMPTAADEAAAEKRIMPYWDEWAKTKGPEAVEALAKVRAALAR